MTRFKNPGRKGSFVAGFFFGFFLGCFAFMFGSSSFTRDVLALIPADRDSALQRRQVQLPVDRHHCPAVRAAPAHGGDLQDVVLVVLREVHPG